MPHTLSDDVLAPHVSLTFVRVCLEAHLTILPRKKAERYLRAIGEILAGEENMASVFQIRPAAHREAQRIATQQAAALYERLLPILLARLPRA